MGLLSILGKVAGPIISGAAPFFISKLFGGGDDDESNLEGFEIPTFEEDPDFRETQDFLKSLGIDILGGEIPEFFAPIGEAGGPELENLINLLSGDIQAAVESAGAATGRTGAVPSIVGEKVGRLSTELRFEDFQRALKGKEFLFREGRGITEGVRAAGQTQQAQVNQFLLNAAGLDLTKRLGLDEQDLLSGEAFGKLAEVGLGAAAGFITGGVPGAVVGAAGGIDFTELLKKEKVGTPVGTKKTSALNLGKIKPFKAPTLRGSVA